MRSGRRAFAAPLTAALLLAALPLSSACSRRDPAAAPAAPADEQLRELRMRVDELERQNAAERATFTQELTAMRADVDNLRASLDEADRQLAEISEESANATAVAPARPRHYSAHAALRQRLRGMYDASRQAVERLRESLDRSLKRTRPENGGENPAK